MTRTRRSRGVNEHVVGMESKGAATQRLGSREGIGGRHMEPP